MWVRGGSDFAAYLSAHCPHLYFDFCIDFSSGSSRFLAALASSASLPPPSSAAPLPSSSHSPFPSAAPAFSSARPSPSAAFDFVFVSAFCPFSSCVFLCFSAFSCLGAVPGGSGVASVAGSVAAPFPVPPPVSAPSLFRPFAADYSSSVTVPSAPLPSALSSTPAFSSSTVVYPGPSSAPAPFVPNPSFIPPDELPDDVASDAVPHDVDSAVPAAVPESARSEFHRMLSFIVDLFLQAAGSPSAP